MKKFLVIAFFLSLIANCNAEDKSRVWLDSICTSKDLKGVNPSLLNTFDISNLISNVSRFEHDPMIYYTGTFGSTFKKIDIKLKITKSDSISLLYNVSGFDRLGNNIRPIDGFMRITSVLKFQHGSEYGNLHLIILDCHFFEPGDRDGDGEFSGIFTITADVNNNSIDLIYSESGDFREYTNVFVGNWMKYNSSSLKSTIFSINPIGLYCELPLSKDFYTFDTDNEDICLPKNKYIQNGWKNYSPKDKIKWWNDKP